MASYDNLGKCQMSAYVLEQGQYRFFVGNNCRQLQACDEGYTVTEAFVVTQQLQQRCAPNLLQKRMRSDGNFEPLPAFPVASYCVEPAKNHARVQSKEGKRELWAWCRSGQTVEIPA